MNSLYGVSYYFQINEKSQYTVAAGYAALGDSQRKSSHKFKKSRNPGECLNPVSNKQICPPAY